MTNSVITPELKALLNKPGERRVAKVEECWVQFFREATEDDSPIYYDPEFAAKTVYKEVTAPPFFLMDYGLSGHVDYVTQFNPLNALLNGGSEIEYFLPMKVGDTITAEPMVVNLEEKEGRSGIMIFVTVQVNFTNQNGDLVSRIKNNFIFR